jgi:MFS family permease
MGKSGETSSSKGIRNVLALGLVSFFTDMSTEMSLSVLPFFIVQELGATIAFLGIIEGFAESISYAFRMVTGVISDRLGKRKLLVFIGYALSTAVKPFFAVAKSWTDALVVRVTDRVGKSIRTAPRDALLSESISDEHLGKAFGLHRTLDQAGAIVGPLLTAALLLIVGLGLREIFWLSFIPGVVALVILLFVVKEAVGKPRQAKFLSDVKQVLSKEFVLLLVVIAVFSVGAFNYSFILSKASELGVVPALGALVYSFIQVTHAAVGIPMGALSDKIGKAQVLLIGYATFFVTSVLCILLQGNPLFAFFIAVVFGVYMGINETIQRALIPKYAPNDLRATAYGIYYLTVGLCFLVADIVVGILWESFSSNMAFTYSTVTSAIAIICMIAFILWERRLKST